MKPLQHLTRRNAVALGAGIWVLPAAAHAYVGPGAGLTAIGTMVALMAALILAIIGFVWYPVKRLMRSNKTPTAVDESTEPRE